jgi:hypothetical protein
VSEIPKQKRAGTGVIMHAMQAKDAITDAMVNADIIAGRSTKPIRLDTTRRASRMNAPLASNARLVMSER